MELKLKQRKTSSNKQKVLFCIVALVLLFVGIGYAYLRAELNFNLTLTIDENVIKSLYEKMIEDNTWILDTNVDFSDATASKDAGHYILSGTENNTNPIRYYRGAQDNNNVIFADKCWKIVRTTDTGGIKVFYNEVSENGTCPENNEYGIGGINTSDVEKKHSMADFGYMFNIRLEFESISSTTNFMFGKELVLDGDTYKLKDTHYGDPIEYNETTKVATPYRYSCLNSSGECSEPVYFVDYNYYVKVIGKNINDTIELMLNSQDASTYTNKYDSIYKREIDGWYERNLVYYTDYLEDTVWCNRKDYTIDYAGIFTMVSPAIKTTPSDFSCPNLIDRFTVSKDNGNGDLKYPIGMLTVNETYLVGGSAFGDYCTEYLTMSPASLFSNNDYPYNFSIFCGRAGSMTTYEHATILPAISFSHDVRYAGGDGTSENPYYVSNPLS